MAKKKQTQQQKTAKNVEEQVSNRNDETTPVATVAIDENTAEKMSNLKSLNVMLVNETAQRRQEVSVLLEEKKLLEAELTRCGMEIESLRSELTRVGEDEGEIERKRCEGELEIERVRACLGVALREKEALEMVVNAKNEEVRGLIEELEGLRKEYEAVVKAGEEEIEGVKKEKEVLLKENDVLRKGEMEYKRRISELGKEVDCLSGENDGLRKGDLEYGRRISELDGVVLGLRESVEKWRVKFFKLEKSNVGVLGELDGLRSEFEVLVVEKNAKEREIECLVEEKLRSLERLEEMEKEIVRVKKVNEDVLEEKEREIECLMEEKSMSLERLGELERKIECVKKVNEGVLKEKKAKEREIESLIVEKSMSFERLGELEKEIECLKRVNEGVFVEKKAKEKEIECLMVEKSVILERLGVFEKEIQGLKKINEVVFEEKRAKEREIECLMKEKSSNLKRLGELEKEIKCVKGVNKAVFEEKSALEEVNLGQESKIRELQLEMDEIRGNVVSIQESNKNELEKNMKLLLEINDHKSELDRVVKARADVMRSLDVEKMNVKELRVQMSEISVKMEETANVFEELVGTTRTLVAEKDELKTKYNKMAQEKGSVEKNYVEAKEKIAELEGLLKSKSGLLESALAMLRNTVMQLSEANKNAEVDGITVNDRGFNGEMSPYMTEIEAIRAVFKGREQKVGEMEKQMEKLHLSVLNAERKKGFWTLVSSATTILAAVVSLAYVKGFH